MVGGWWWDGECVVTREGESKDVIQWYGTIVYVYSDSDSDIRIKIKPKQRTMRRTLASSFCSEK